MKRLKIFTLVLVSTFASGIFASEFKQIVECKITDGPFNVGTKVTITQSNVGKYNDRFNPLLGIKIQIPAFMDLFGELQSKSYSVMGNHRSVGLSSDDSSVKAALLLSKHLGKINKRFKANLILVLPENMVPITFQEIFNFDLKCKVDPKF